MHGAMGYSLVDLILGHLDKTTTNEVPTTASASLVQIPNNRQSRQYAKCTYSSLNKLLIVCSSADDDSGVALSLRWADSGEVGSGSLREHGHFLLGHFLIS